MKDVYVTLISIFALVLLFWSPWNNRDVATSVVENFDGTSQTSLGKAIVDHQFVQLVKERGYQGTDGLEVTYDGYERGSRRVVISPFIQPASQYSLSFWVQFCDGFDFARGGKLHGVGPANPVAGGNAITPEGWSARLMFRGDGGLQTYIYHQNMAGRFGDTQRAEGFVFEPGRYYQVRMQVALNTPASASNGSVTVWVDDQRLIEHTELRFRDRESESSQIQRFLFSTFHGGSSPEWAPRNSDGSYKTDCAYFDTIALTPSP